MGKYQNPADYVIKLGQAPYLCNPVLDLVGMSITYDNILRPHVDQGIAMREKRYQEIDTNFMDFAENRGASFFK